MSPLLALIVSLIPVTSLGVLHATLSINGTYERWADEEAGK